GDTSEHTLIYPDTQLRIVEHTYSVKISHAEQHDLVSSANQLCLSGHHCGKSQVIEGLLYRGDVPRVVVNDCDAHSSPFVLGSKRFICLSRQQAARSARANALKSASIL